jgi:hypothetical protein
MSSAGGGSLQSMKIDARFTAVLQFWPKSAEA